MVVRAARCERCSAVQCKLHCDAMRSAALNTGRARGKERRGCKREKKREERERFATVDYGEISVQVSLV